MSLTGNFGIPNNDKTAKTVDAGDKEISSETTSAINHQLESKELEKPSVSEEDAGSDISEARRDKELHELARKYTNNSNFSTSELNPFEAPKESRLDPSSPNFNARAWAKAFLNLQARDPEKFPGRTAGFAFKNVNVHGAAADMDFQKNVGNVYTEVVAFFKKMLNIGQRTVDILQDFEGLVDSGELLVVLGPPGSGCSTFLKTISGETYGFEIDPNSYINYQGVSMKEMHSDFRGEAIYTAEVDVHFPMMTVGDTLYFAARARAPKFIPGGVSKHEYAEHMRDVIMATFGISHTLNTQVGNDFVRGVSGGERKRVSIAEAALSGSPLQCWDNSTRGLDSANAIEFCKTLRMSADLSGSTCAVAIYQAPQSAYDIFDKVLVLYEGRQIYFGPTTAGQKFFEDMGFECPARQTTADFLTSMTSPIERVVKKGWEDRVPRTPDEFAAKWKGSETRARLLEQIDEFDRKYTIGGEYRDKFLQSRRVQQAKRSRPTSPYTLSYTQQIRLCLWRGFQRLKGDPTVTFTQIFGNSIMALVIGSVFYNLKQDTASFYQRGALLFFAMLMNAFGSALEILTLYAQRPIVEKHTKYALYHPSTEAIASMLTDMPYKLGNAITFNLVLYFMTNLRREPGPFFFFLLTSFTLQMVMSMMFRTIASVSRTMSQAMAPTGILILGIVIYTGFAIPVRYMLGWSRWINYINPVAYGFESLMVNEFHNREFTCSSYVPFGPSFPAGPSPEVACSAVGSTPGSAFVNGDVYINSAFAYYHSHKWRNYGILWVFLLGFLGAYILATEFISAKKSKGEVLVFKRGHIPASLKEQPTDEEAGEAQRTRLEKMGTMASNIIQRQTAIFQWRDVCFDIKIKKENRRILDHVDGWVKPGTLTALMGVSGAGKTTLLDVLATRTTIGVISGEMLVDGRQRDESFQRKTGYVQQQDLHLSTTTVREALAFSALLRQPAHVSRQEKLDYVNDVITLLDMEEYADAIVGVPGEGLNVEQRKRLTIGVELAARPQLLLFLDEPTSGLDSQTSWAICDLMEKLKRNGQAILCTIHQPSAMLFQRFDRLLFLASGGKTVYFGEVGENSKILIDYFERNGGKPCPAEANPAEWMLEVIGAAPGATTDIDWHKVWRESPEIKAVHEELDTMKAERSQVSPATTKQDDPSSYREFAAPFFVQMAEVQKRVFQQYWRTPSYIYSKFFLGIVAALFVGFSFFRALNTQQGLQNQLFSIFMVLTIFSQLVQQIMPHFVTQRALYEVRERPSKAYSWKAFMLSQILVEIPWNTLLAVFMYVCWYYPVGLYRNAEYTDKVAERGALMFLIFWVFLIFTSTFTDMVIAAIADAETGGNIANLIFSLSLIFCGVLAPPATLPGFWIFMYRVSPFTYIVSSMIATGVGNSVITCAANEYLQFAPPANLTCGEYLYPWTSTVGGYLQDPEARDECNFCAMDDTNAFLTQVSSSYDTRWRDFGIIWAYVAFNIGAALGLYWLARVPKKSKKAKEE
ncbi:ABC drug exporter AbcA [Aulographum hederae CBS 113979]|uniref:ABC drug exporter AbcA n=1 Tax=Aulographum hederae CBS 113979 TaxID=1176131 RepID=A0A6G1GTE0_9PEZI|nr:ABC drug exporter AbcA [Aulographum hederae CBS 113979]